MPLCVPSGARGPQRLAAGTDGICRRETQRPLPLPARPSAVTSLPATTLSVKPAWQGDGRCRFPCVLEGPPWLLPSLRAVGSCSALLCPARLTHRLRPGSSRRRLGPELAQVWTPRASLSGEGGCGRTGDASNQEPGLLGRPNGARGRCPRGQARQGPPSGGRPWLGLTRPRSQLRFRLPCAGRSVIRGDAREVVSRAAAELLGTRGGAGGQPRPLAEGAPQGAPVGWSGLGRERMPVSVSVRSQFGNALALGESAGLGYECNCHEGSFGNAEGRVIFLLG